MKKEPKESETPKGKRGKVKVDWAARFKQVKEAIKKDHIPLSVALKKLKISSCHFYENITREQKQELKSIHNLEIGRIHGQKFVLEPEMIDEEDE
ncbi:MAG: hypothetical protein WC795_02310 [Candidatus Paceibacterota bacterium]|jgi:hypothetical protein